MKMAKNSVHCFLKCACCCRQIPLSLYSFGMPCIVYFVPSLDLPISLSGTKFSEKFSSFDFNEHFIQSGYGLASNVVVLLSRRKSMHGRTFPSDFFTMAIREQYGEPDGRMISLRSMSFISSLTAPCKCNGHCFLLNAVLELSLM